MFPDDVTNALKYVNEFIGHSSPAGYQYSSETFRLFLKHAIK